MNRKYRYIGPIDLLEEGRQSKGGMELNSTADVRAWLAGPQAEPDGDRWPATYIVTADGVLKFASRRSEHVSCASGQDVLAAGELFFGADGSIIAATNQSTGYCPDPECWAAVKQAIERAGLQAPTSFETAFVFRRCLECGERNLVKEAYFVCSLCDAELPLEWNF